MMEEEKNTRVINHFEAGSNCQVFNAPVSGCVFAMPGSNVTQQTADQPVSRKEDILTNQLKPMFFGAEEEVRSFLLEIKGMKPKQITARVNQLVKENKLSEISCHRDLWQVLHNCGIYTPTESNWNQQIR